MSKQSYIKGFSKVAEAHGVDPERLAQCAVGMQKRSLDLGPIKANTDAVIAKLKALAESAKDTYSGMSPLAKGLVNAGAGAGVGSLAGLGIGSMFGRSGRGAWIGALAGGLPMAAGSVDWKSLKAKIEEWQKNRKEKKRIDDLLALSGRFTDPNDVKVDVDI